jgi:hypothetical protein
MELEVAQSYGRQRMGIIDTKTHKIYSIEEPTGMAPTIAYYIDSVGIHYYIAYVGSPPDGLDTNIFLHITINNDGTWDIDAKKITGIDTYMKSIFAEATDYEIKDALTECYIVANGDEWYVVKSQPRCYPYDDGEEYFEGHLVINANDGTFMFHEDDPSFVYKNAEFGFTSTEMDYGQLVLVWRGATGSMYKTLIIDMSNMSLISYGTSTSYSTLQQILYREATKATSLVEPGTMYFQWEVLPVPFLKRDVIKGDEVSAGCTINEYSLPTEGDITIDDTYFA